MNVRNFIRPWPLLYGKTKYWSFEVELFQGWLSFDRSLPGTLYSNVLHLYEYKRCILSCYLPPSSASEARMCISTSSTSLLQAGETTVETTSEDTRPGDDGPCLIRIPTRFLDVLAGRISLNLGRIEMNDIDLRPGDSHATFCLLRLCCGLYLKESEWYLYYHGAARTPHLDILAGRISLNRGRIEMKGIDLRPGDSHATFCLLRFML